jgi:mRNA export factor
MVFALKSMAAKDAELVDPPPDSVSKLAFSPVANILAVGSWDNGVSYMQL